MKKNLEKNYDPSIVEDKIYANWLEKKYFNTEIDKNKEPYTIVMPPPNITGKLHMGHALDNTIQDILIRFKRMQGFNALWIPGTDHASISTEVKIVNQMAEEGITKKDIGRDGFLERAWAWKELYGGEIINQIKKLGSSCDWERERFTMDEGLSEAVLDVFVRLYEKDLIYKGEKLINWCTHCKTTISDAEVEHKDVESGFWHMKYPVDGTDEFLVFATTRPETLVGDTAVAVNPDDERYKKFIGMTITIPFIGRKIPIIADEYVEKDFGTGVVKITPAHDPNDFEIGERHNLEKINVLNDDGTINHNGGKYKGLDRFEARKQIVEDFDSIGLFVKKEELNNAVGTHERCGTVIEPLIKLQWFLKMEELAKPALEVYRNNTLRFIPDRFGKVYTNWLENIHDWCISRQLWWGHRIPAFYCKDCGEMVVQKDAPTSCKKCGSKNIIQDEDTLDTWFSSALWPFSTLGWPEKTPDFEYFYPTSVLVTGYDIIFFWVVRMVFSALEHTGEIPFNDVLIHGLVRDSQGRKMSKSLGNGIDPLEVIDKYGADVLRLTLVTGNAPGNDLRFQWERIESNRNFLNKIWNATRFMLMNFEDMDTLNLSYNESMLTSTDKWIISKVNRLSKDVTENLENYDMGIAVQKIFDFIWDEYCDWYIEMVKPRLYNKDDETRESALWTLKFVLSQGLKLLHPFMPFITEEIFTAIQDDEETIMLSNWPVFEDRYNFEEDEIRVEQIKVAVKFIRNMRAEMNVAPSKKVDMFLVSDDEGLKLNFEKSRVFFDILSGASSVAISSDKIGIPEDAVSVVIPNAVIYIPLDSLVDIVKEIERLEKSRDNLINEVNRIDKKLGNEGFVKKAPENIILEEKEKREKYQAMLDQVNEQIDKLANR